MLAIISSSFFSSRSLAIALSTHSVVRGIYFLSFHILKISTDWNPSNCESLSSLFLAIPNVATLATALPKRLAPEPRLSKKFPPFSRFLFS